MPRRRAARLGAGDWVLLVDERFSGIDAAAATPAYRQLHLQFPEAGCALLHRVANLTIGDAVTHANVHI